MPNADRGQTDVQQNLICNNQMPNPRKNGEASKLIKHIDQQQEVWKAWAENDLSRTMQLLPIISYCTFIYSVQ